MAVPISQHEFPWVRGTLLAILAAVAVVTLDRMLPNITLTPIIGLGLVAILALHKSASELLIWILIIAAT